MTEKEAIEIILHFWGEDLRKGKPFKLNGDWYFESTLGSEEQPCFYCVCDDGKVFPVPS